MTGAADIAVLNRIFCSDFVEARYNKTVGSITHIVQLCDADNYALSEYYTPKC